ncbi:MAG TPA: glycine cleavage T C-terminal barrel domain-containing protein [Rhizomicrobium sp.]
MTDAPRATPFHGRAAARNRFNRWAGRGGFTLAEDYGDAQEEALAARTGAVITDISWRWRVFVEGAKAGPFLNRLVTRDANALMPGQALKALWLNDGGAVRGAAVVARFASDKFLLASAATDAAWLSMAASPFDVTLRDVTEQEGGIALIGPYADQILRAAGLDADVAPLEFRKVFWRGLDVTISRWGEQGGYEIWVAANDCFFLWDRLLKAGAQFGIQPAGLAAADILDIEAGVPRPERDYSAARDGFISEPTPNSLGLESLIDEHHTSFNGRAGWLANRTKSKAVLVGVEFDSETPASFTALIQNGRPVGHTLTSVRSPTLRRAIALAQIERPAAVLGANFALTLPISLESPAYRTVSARVAVLPFFESPVSIAL